MGTDKATLCLAGQPLWRRQLNLLLALQPQNLWISARSVPPWCPEGLEVVLDSPPSRGPLSGISACLQRLEAPHLIVLAIDMPQMTPEHLSKLLALVRPGRSLLPVNGNYFEPTCAIYSQSAVPFAAAALNEPGASLQRFCQKLTIENVADSCLLRPEERPFYHNLNHPQDFDALTERQGGV